MLHLKICAGSILLSRQNSNPTARHMGLCFWIESPGLSPENLYVLTLPRDLKCEQLRESHDGRLGTRGLLGTT